MTRLVLVLPEPPSLNEMIDLAKQRTRRSRTGGWMRKTLPVVYDQRKEQYEMLCLAVSRQLGMKPPPTPWERWRLERAEFRVHLRRDPLELIAGLKWTIDWLVREGFVVDDGPDHLLHIPTPAQRIDRGDRGVTIVISEVA